TAVGILALALTGNEAHLTYYKSGTFATGALHWPDSVDAVKKANAFIGCAISHR
ncbi:TPA: head decoration protein, partial [Providencia alcalifaciens]